MSVEDRRTGGNGGAASATPDPTDPTTYGLPSEPLVEVSRLKGALTIAAAKCNLLAPEMQIDRVPRSYAVSFRIVRLPSDLGGEFSNGVWYKQEGGKLALHYSALNLLAQAAGVTWEEVTSVPTREIHLWRTRAVATCRSFDGTIRREVCSRELDLRDGSAEAAGMKTAQLGKARANGAQLCESKAKARVIRALLGMRASYSMLDARKPFVVPALIYMPPDDPEIDRMIAARELGIVAEVYGGRPAPVARASVVDVPVAPPPRALPDHGPRIEVDFQAEAERLAQRAKAGGTSFEEGGGWDEQEMPPDLDPACSTCGQAVSDRAASWFRERGRPILCKDHLQAGGPK